VKHLRWQLVVACLCIPAAGCAQYPHTAPLPVSTPAGSGAREGYKFENFRASGANTDSVFLILTFSGGGTRAAALAYGVLLELEKTSIDTGSSRRSLLDEVDVISTISGGSFAGAYYALYGKDSLAEFEDRFLTWNAESYLKRQLLTPAILRLASPRYSRSDLAAETWDARLFHNATFDVLAHRGTRPYLIVNATDMVLGAPFSFTQEQFDPLCDDLSKFPISRAVASSSAFPGLLTPITIESHAERCRYQTPAWVSSGLADAHSNPDAYRAASDYATYTDIRNRPFIHLIDGGVADNLGIRPILRALESTSRDLDILALVANGIVKRIIVIAVNARTMSGSNLNKNAAPPGLIDVLKAGAGVPFDNYSNESLSRLDAAAVESIREKRAADCYNALLRKANPAAQPPSTETLIPIDVIHLTFDDIKDPVERAFFYGVPTSFALPRTSVIRLRDIGGRLLQENEQFRHLLAELRFTGRVDKPACLGQ
jgi:NTE family protein